jgi:hypothetical protein
LAEHFAFNMVGWTRYCHQHPVFIFITGNGFSRNEGAARSCGPLKDKDKKEHNGKTGKTHEEELIINSA